MLYVCVRDVMCGAVGACVWKIGVFCHVYVMCASSGSTQCCDLHDLQFVNAGRGCKRRPYGRGILQSRSHDCPIGSHECLLLFISSCYGECFYYLKRLVCVY